MLSSRSSKVHARSSVTNQARRSGRMCLVPGPRAIQLLKEKPPERRFARSAPSVLRELGASPQGETIRLMNGRYGPYVTDGKINASLRQSHSPDTITLDEAVELLRERADRGPGRKPVRKREKGTARRKKKSG